MAEISSGVFLFVVRRGAEIRGVGCVSGGRGGGNRALWLYVARAHGKPIGNFRYRGCTVTTERNEVVAVLCTKDSHVSFSIIQSGWITSVRNTPNEGTNS